MRVGRIKKGSVLRKKDFFGTGLFWTHSATGDCLYAYSSEASSHQVLNDFLNYYNIETSKNGAISNSLVRFFCEPKDAYYLKKELSNRGFLFKVRLTTSQKPVNILIDTQINSFKIAGGIDSSAFKKKNVACIFKDESEMLSIKNVFQNNLDFSFSFFNGESQVSVPQVLASNPDVLLLSLDLQKIGAVKILEKIYDSKFIPAVLASGKKERDSLKFVQCFQLGASDYISVLKTDDFQVLLQQKLFNALEIQKHESSDFSFDATTEKLKFSTSEGVLCIGASTGGTEAIRNILENLPLEGPPIVIAQHIPKYFASAFTDSLKNATKKRVIEAQNGMKVESNCVYLPPGGKHVRIEGSGAKATLVLMDPQAELNYVPSVDILFESAASVYKNKTYGVILTGMGRDGALGCAEIKRSGGSVVAQNKETCVVYGMPRVVIEQDLADIICPVDAVSSFLIKLVA